MSSHGMSQFSWLRFGTGAKSLSDVSDRKDMHSVSGSSHPRRVDSISTRWRMGTWSHNPECQAKEVVGIATAVRLKGQSSRPRQATAAGRGCSRQAQ